MGDYIEAYNQGILLDLQNATSDVALSFTSIFIERLQEFHKVDLEEGSVSNTCGNIAFSGNVSHSRVP